MCGFLIAMISLFDFLFKKQNIVNTYSITQNTM